MDVTQFIKKNRKREFSLVATYLKRRQSVNILGMSGVGKTAFINLIKENVSNTILISMCTPTQFLNRLAKKFRIHTADTDLKIERLKEKNFVILVDDYAEIRPQLNRILKLIGCPVVGTSRARIRRFFFNKTIELKPLSEDASKHIIKKFVKDKRVVRLLLHKTQGLPERIVRYTEDYLKCRKDLKTTRDVHRFACDLMPVIIKRINLLPLSAIFLIGYLLLISKYVFYGMEDYKEGYLVAIFGYLAIAVSRFAFSRKKY